MIGFCLQLKIDGAKTAIKQLIVVLNHGAELVYADA